MPLVRYESTVYSLKGGVSTFIAPCKEPALEVNLPERLFIEKMVKLTHRSSIPPAIVLVHSLIYHVEITTQEPRGAYSHLPELMKFL
jgi:hypothetical protein